MGLLGNLTGKVLQSVAQATSDNNTSESAKGINNTSAAACESLKPLIRSILMKDEVTDKDRQILARKAVSLGLDADEVSIQFDSLEAAKKKKGKKSLFGKPKYDEYFECGYFDEDFDDIFLTDEERMIKVKKENQDFGEELGNTIGLLSKMGGL